MELRQDLISEIIDIIEVSRDRAIRSVDFERVLMYWKIGSKIVVEEQHGKERAEYGTFLLKSLSSQLEPRYGSGFSYRQLNLFRQFYKEFPIVQTLSAQLSWSHYSLLVRIGNEDKRAFYIAECCKNNWSVRQLERQINSSLFERLLLSNDIKSVMEIARNEKLPSDAKIYTNIKL